MAGKTEDAPQVNRLVHVFFIILGLILLVAGYFQLPVNPTHRAGDGEAEIAFRLVRMVVGALAIIAGIGLDSRRAWAWWMGVMILVLMVVRVATELAISLGRVGYYGDGDYLAKLFIVIAGVICLRALGILLWRRRAYTK
jgi:lysylphosphatidylglycerol synthetase-like protein (DUF2156 family)